MTYILLSLFAIAGTSRAEETPHYEFVSEYVRGLSVTENIRVNAEQELKKKGSNPLVVGIRTSTRTQLELRTSIAVLGGMHLDPPFEHLIENISDFYEQKIELHQDMIDIASLWQDQSQMWTTESSRRRRQRSVRPSNSSIN